MQWESDLIVTISGGVMEARNDESAGLLQKVDNLLYMAKHMSKNLIGKEDTLLLGHLLQGITVTQSIGESRAGFRQTELDNINVEGRKCTG